MNSKIILLSLFISVFALFVISSVCAIDNETILQDNSSQVDEINSDLEFNQDYSQNIVQKNEIFEVYLSVKNNGLDTFHNLSIYYPLPEGLKLLIFPKEYDGQSWFIDTLYPSETTTLTLICEPLIANTTYDFVVSYGGTEISEMNIYCEPSKDSDIIPDNPIPDNPIPDDYGMINALKSVNSDNTELKDTANPIFLLLFTLIFIPYIRIKY